MFSEPDLSQIVLLFHLRPGKLIVHHFLVVNTSFALSLLAWFSDASIFSNSSISATKMCLLSRFPPRTIRSRGISLVRLSCRTDAVAAGLWQKKGDIRPSNGIIGPLNGSRIAVRKVFSHQTRDLECFTDSSSTPWNPPIIFHPDLIATVQQKSLQ